MSGRLMGMVMATGLSSTCKLVMLAYAWHAKDADPLAYPGQERLERETGLDERTIRKWVTWLKDEAHQLLIPAGYKHHTPAYRINVTLLASMEVLKAETCAGLEEAEPAPDAGFTDPKAAPDSGLQDKPAPDAALKIFKPESSAAKPESGAGILGKPESSAAKPAPESPYISRTKEDINQVGTKEEEESPAAPAPKRIITAPEAERIFTEITGMTSIPGGLEERELALGTIFGLHDKHQADTIPYLKPYFQAQIHTNNRSGRPYQKTGLLWLTEWAVAEELPDYVRQQLLRKPPASLPTELREMILAGRDTRTANPGPRRPAGILGNYNQATVEAARSLGLGKG